MFSFPTSVLTQKSSYRLDRTDGQQYQKECQGMKHTNHQEDRGIAKTTAQDSTHDQSKHDSPKGAAAAFQAGHRSHRLQYRASAAAPV